MRTSVILVMAVGLLLGCKGREPEPVAVAPAPGTPEWKIASARSAAPAEIASVATVRDWPAEGDTTWTMPVLAEGANGWTCMPDFGPSPADDPVCVDSVASRFFDSLLVNRPPALRVMGLVYQLKGGQFASVTDPHKQVPDSGADWVTLPPNIAMLVPDPRRTFAGLPTARTDAGPWVAFAGTPYAMLIVPAGVARP